MAGDAENVIAYMNLHMNQASLSTQALSTAASTLQAQDLYTRGHTQRVRRISRCIAERLGLSEEESFLVEIGALLHDVGKVGLADAILSKPGPLVREEYEQIREHPVKGRRILGNIACLERAIPCVLHHHERFDGRGYPERLAGQDIPLSGRIISVADAFDAMTSDRPYRRRLRVRTALAELRRGAGRQFDPKVVQAFLRVWRRGRLAGLLEGANQPA
jgi:HD-GYP domain-containing protein (c-di-GMP phosphodiesterase class II)